MAGWGNLDARESRCEVTSRRQKLLVRNTIQPFMNKDVCSIVWLVVGIHYERESRSRSNVTTREAMSFMNEDRRSKMTICKDNVLGYQFRSMYEESGFMYYVTEERMKTRKCCSMYEERGFVETSVEIVYFIAKVQEANIRLDGRPVKGIQTSESRSSKDLQRQR
uniref:uncharacterized protein LOC101242471 isoform X9 n=1 Tax=Ciona intestinalis TaxID=7719 RepID=UPI000EF4D925|nr:uncharacterized protein LOC101242471 isoform X9 [Ciona intestinalis]|eukprot:XP_026693202.1 uncharacterized protein LOC101242471 isoform X9 [Ciona intestinalis]